MLIELQILEELKKMNQFQILNYVIPFLLGLITTVIGILIGYIISKKQSQTSIIINYHTDYLNKLNDLIFDINDLISNINNINKFGYYVLNNNFKTYAFSAEDDYYNIANKTKQLREVLCNPNNNFSTQIQAEMNYKYLLGACNYVLDSGLFIKIFRKYDRGVIDKINFLDKSIKNFYCDIINRIYSYTKKEMKDFYIENFKKELILHANDSNKIISKKLKIKKFKPIKI